LNLEREKTYLAALPEGVPKVPNDLYKDPNASLTPGWDEDDEDMLVETDEEKLKKRTKEILQTVRGKHQHSYLPRQHNTCEQMDAVLFLRITELIIFLTHILLCSNLFT
jgi:hypothetical protein